MALPGPAPGYRFLSGAGTHQLTVHGYPITVDARQLTTARFIINRVIGQHDTSVPHTFRLIPGPHQFVRGDVEFTFTVTTAGTVDYSTALTYLSGKGSSTLVVRNPGP